MGPEYDNDDEDDCNMGDYYDDWEDGWDDDDDTGEFLD